MITSRLAAPRTRCPSRFGTALTMLLLGIATGTPAQAAIVYFSVNPAQTITGNTTVTFGDINLSNGTFSLGGSSPSFGLGSTSGTDNTLFAQDNNGIQWAITGTNTGQGEGEVAKFAATTSISGSSIANWTANDPNLFTSSHTQDWYATGTGYAGLRIDAGGGNYNYGWVSVEYNVATSTATVTGFAFENQINTGIPAAALPEPTSLALVAAGTAIVATVYQRRRHQRGNRGSPGSVAA